MLRISSLILVAAAACQLPSFLNISGGRSSGPPPAPAAAPAEGQEAAAEQQPAAAPAPQPAPAAPACVDASHMQVTSGPWRNSRAPSLDQDCDPANVKSVQACALGTCVGWNDGAGSHGKCVFACGELKNVPQIGQACSPGLTCAAWKGGAWCMPNELQLCESAAAAPKKKRAEKCWDRRAAGAACKYDGDCCSEWCDSGRCG
jgi:hypothetical protein